MRTSVRRKSIRKRNSKSSHRRRTKRYSRKSNGKVSKNKMVRTSNKRKRYQKGGDQSIVPVKNLYEKIKNKFVPEPTLFPGAIATPLLHLTPKHVDSHGTPHYAKYYVSPYKQKYN